MVTYRYLSDKFLKPLHEKLRAEGREEVQLRWASWNQRRLEAESRTASLSTSRRLAQTDLAVSNCLKSPLPLDGGGLGWG